MPLSAFDQLSEPVKRWVWQQKWPSLRNVQDLAIPAIIAGGDAVVSARTAAGKTEAAMLPLLTRMAKRDPSTPGFSVLYVSPLKALINDQYRRLQGLCDACDVILHKWHGDVSASAKAAARKRPSGIVLITPESLEALLVRRGAEIRYLFSALDAVVIDELHAFIGTERGIQLQSILSRIEVAVGRERIDRIGLSATLGDMNLAAEALRPGGASQVRQITGKDVGNGVRIEVRGYTYRKTDNTTSVEADEKDVPLEPVHPIVPPALAADLFRLLRGRRNLLFAGSRQKVEIYTDCLRERCEAERLPHEFFPHHGSLSKAEREDVEARLRDDPRPTTAVATTTLELGIDIGDVETVAQIGPGYSVASLRQRLGRSGRRAGKAAILRIFALEPEPGKGRHPLERLNLDLIQSIAMIECLRSGWCEPPARAGLHLSTLLHQVLALILQTGGIAALPAWKMLCERGPFKAVDRQLFASLLRCMASSGNKLIEQSPDGLLMAGENGEREAESHEFYPVFATEKEYRILHDARMLGVYPLDSPIARGETIIFAGRRWKVADFDDNARVIMVKPAKGARPPKFSGEPGAIHDEIVARMRGVLRGTEAFPYLDEPAEVLLDQARQAYQDLRLDETSMMRLGEGVLIFPWVGSKKLKTLSLAFTAGNFEGGDFGHAIELDNTTVSAVNAFLSRIADGTGPDADTLAARVAKPQKAKFDHYLSPDLMDLVTVRERLEVETLREVAAALRASREAAGRGEEVGDASA